MFIVAPPELVRNDQQFVPTGHLPATGNPGLNHSILFSATIVTLNSKRECEDSCLLTNLAIPAGLAAVYEGKGHVVHLRTLLLAIRSKVENSNMSPTLALFVSPVPDHIQYHVCTTRFPDFSRETIFSPANGFIQHEILSDQLFLPQPYGTTLQLGPVVSTMSGDISNTTVASFLETWHFTHRLNAVTHFLIILRPSRVPLSIGTVSRDVSPFALSTPPSLLSRGNSPFSSTLNETATQQDIIPHNSFPTYDSGYFNVIICLQ